MYENSLEPMPVKPLFFRGLLDQSDAIMVSALEAVFKQQNEADRKRIRRPKLTKDSMFLPSHGPRTRTRFTTPPETEREWMRETIAYAYAIVNGGEKLP